MTTPDDPHARLRAEGDEPIPLLPTCCGGTGFADYAAVPCPDPTCPVRFDDEGRPVPPPAPGR